MTGGGGTFSRRYGHAALGANMWHHQSKQPALPPPALSMMRARALAASRRKLAKGQQWNGDLSSTFNLIWTDEGFVYCLIIRWLGVVMTLIRRAGVWCTCSSVIFLTLKIRAALLIAAAGCQGIQRRQIWYSAPYKFYLIYYYDSSPSVSYRLSWQRLRWWVAVWIGALGDFWYSSCCDATWKVLVHWLRQHPLFVQLRGGRQQQKVVKHTTRFKALKFIIDSWHKELSGGGLNRTKAESNPGCHLLKTIFSFCCWMVFLGESGGQSI